MTVALLIIFMISGGTEEVAQQSESVISFCEEKGFSDFKYTDNAANKFGFCYKQIPGYIKKKDFFIDNDNEVWGVYE